MVPHFDLSQLLSANLTTRPRHVASFIRGLALALDWDSKDEAPRLEERRSFVLFLQDPQAGLLAVDYPIRYHNLTRDLDLVFLAVKLHNALYPLRVGSEQENHVRYVESTI